MPLCDRTMQLLIAGVIATIPLLSHASEPPRYSAMVGTDLAPLVASNPHDPNGVDGVVGEIMSGVLRTAGIKNQVALRWRPWKRAQMELAIDPHAIIFPLTRLPERETSYLWVGQLLTIRCYVYTAIADHKIEEPKDLFALRRVGVLAGSPMEIELQRLYGTNSTGKLETYHDELINLKKLLAGRIDAWVVPDLVADYYLKKYVDETGHPRPTLYRKMFLVDLPLWLATNIKFPTTDAIALREAVQRFRATPEYRSILRKYGQFDDGK